MLPFSVHDYIKDTDDQRCDYTDGRRKKAQKQRRKHCSRHQVMPRIGFLRNKVQAVHIFIDGDLFELAHSAEGCLKRVARLLIRFEQFDQPVSLLQEIFIG